MIKNSSYIKTGGAIGIIILLLYLPNPAPSSPVNSPGKNMSVTGGELRDFLVQECSEKLKVIKKLLSTGSKSDFNRGIELTVNIPFDNRCNSIHYYLIDDLISKGIYPEKYNILIKQTINSIEDPSMDYRTSWCLRYVSSDGKIDESEWESALDMVKNGKLISLPVYFRHLFSGIDRLPVEQAKSRIDVILGKREEFRHLNSQDGALLLFTLIKGLYPGNDGNYPVVISTLNRYQNLIPDTDEQNREAALIYSGIYSKLTEKNRNRRMIEKTLSGMISFLKRRKLSEGPARIVISTALTTERKIRHTRDPFYETQLSMINRDLHDLICHSLVSSNYLNNINKRKKYVLRNRITCREGE